MVPSRASIRGVGEAGTKFERSQTRAAPPGRELPSADIWNPSPVVSGRRGRYDAHGASIVEVPRGGRTKSMGVIRCALGARAVRPYVMRRYRVIQPVGWINRSSAAEVRSELMLFRFDLQGN